MTTRFPIVRKVGVRLLDQDTRNIWIYADDHAASEIASAEDLWMSLKPVAVDQIEDSCDAFDSKAQRSRVGAIYDANSPSAYCMASIGDGYEEPSDS